MCLHSFRKQFAHYAQKFMLAHAVQWSLEWWAYAFTTREDKFVHGYANMLTSNWSIQQKHGDDSDAKVENSPKSILLSV